MAQNRFQKENWSVLLSTASLILKTVIMKDADKHWADGMIILASLGKCEIQNNSKVLWMFIFYNIFLST